MILAILAAALGSACDRAALASTEVREIGIETVPIDGDWQFRLGDDRQWAAPDLDDSAWEKLQANRPWGEQGHAGYHGFAWYRRHIALRSTSDGVTGFSLLLPDVEQAYEVYWNGALVGRCGDLPPRPVWFMEQAPRIFPLAGEAAGVLAIRVWNAPPLSDEDPGLRGGFQHLPLVGMPAAIARARDALEYQWLRAHLLLFAETLLYGLVALLSFLAWVRNRDQWVLFWMTGFTLPSVLVVLLLRCRLSIPYTTAMAWTQPLDTLRDISLWFLLLWLFDLRTEGRLLRATRSLAVLTLVFNVLDGMVVAVAWHPSLLRLAQTADAVITAINTLAQLFPLLLLAATFARRKRLSTANWLVAVSALLLEMVIAAVDTSQQGRRFTHWSLDALINGPLVTLGRSHVSLMEMLQALLFVCIVYAVHSSFQEHLRHEQLVGVELRNARELQRVLVPDAPFDFPGFRLTSAYRPALQVGGDFYQVIPVQHDAELATMIVIGDVSGKGLAAAMSVSFIVGVIRALAGWNCGPAELLHELNLRIAGRLQGGFATCLALRVHHDGSCAISSAGHPVPYIDGEELEIPGALPLGINAAMEYEETNFELQPGQICTLYTDGLPEARKRTGELYGFPRLEKLLASRPSAEQAAAAAVEFGQNDDISVVVLRRLPPAHDPAASELAEGRSRAAGTLRADAEPTAIS